MYLYNRWNFNLLKLPTKISSARTLQETWFKTNAVQSPGNFNHLGWKMQASSPASVFLSSGNNPESKEKLIFFFDLAIFFKYIKMRSHSARQQKLQNSVFMQRAFWFSRTNGVNCFQVKTVLVILNCSTVSTVSNSCEDVFI